MPENAHSNYSTIALISHASKVMLKILQARPQQYMNCELPDVQAGFRKGRGTRDQIANICWIIEKARKFTLMAEGEEELNSILIKVKEESEKAGLKLNIQKTKITSSPITSRHIDGETMEAVTDFILLGSKMTADGDFSHEIKRHSLLGRKTMTNLVQILKSRDITLQTKVHLIKAMVSFTADVWM